MKAGGCTSNNKKESDESNAILVRLNPALLNEMDEIASKSYMSRQEFIRDAIRAAIEKKKHKDDLFVSW